MIHRNPIMAGASPLLQLFMLVAIILVSFLIISFLGILIGMPFFGRGILDAVTAEYDLADPGMLGLLKYLQIVSQVGFFVIPPFLFAFLITNRIFRYLGLDTAPSYFSIIMGSILVVIALPFLHWLAGLNEMLNLPEFMSGIEEWMKNSEKRARELTEAFISVDTYPGLMVNLLMIAILPAIGEELLFRGLLIRFFRDWTKNIHVAVIITSILFSAFHFQFYGFVPRLFLGLVLGYLFVWTGSLWVPILVHFINNGLAVIVSFYTERSGGTGSFEDIGAYDNPVFIISSGVIVMIMLFLVLIYEKKRKHRNKGISS